MISFFVLQVLLWDGRNTSKSIGTLSYPESTTAPIGMLTTIRFGQTAETSNFVYAGYENGSVAIFDIRTRR
jgi:hypothetical protein